MVTYTGELNKDNKATGVGTVDIPGEGVWKGTFLQNKLHGLATRDGVETFEFKEGKKHGKGSLHDGIFFHTGHTEGTMYKNDPVNPDELPYLDGKALKAIGYKPPPPPQEQTMQQYWASQPSQAIA